ncbi:TadE family type IV pilus minor pilin [Isoptericola sp. b490]|uniref:TadE family type IV pilus minor pilin n=1 Tax=Actinotalea lenta TaxID=3064654 RepID=UPI0027136106|nr:TadE family type IV pilus minor pilin [Isoptericola sp. b490]MDO8121757.1 TadE family type IV pilus minor pilin [Isoptericola sp. b490]
MTEGVGHPAGVLALAAVARARRPAGRPTPVTRADHGAVTVELAVSLPAALLVIAVVLVTVAAAGLQLRAAEAARTGARLAALALDDASVTRGVRRVLPGADVDVERDPPWVTVRVAATAPGGPLTAGPLTVRSSAVAWLERAPGRANGQERSG